MTNVQNSSTKSRSSRRAMIYVYSLLFTVLAIMSSIISRTRVGKSADREANNSADEANCNTARGHAKLVGTDPVAF
jgi:hypothetical protein